MTAESDPAGPPRLRRRRAVVLTVVGVAAVAATGGVLVATSIKSPAQLAAETAPPPPTQLSAPVTRQVITGTVRAPGVVKPPPEVTELGGPGSAALAVFTRTVLRRGATVQPGQVIVEVSGRPLFAFPGAVPAYRDLVPGDTGADVAQLQRGLAAIGYPTGFDTAGTLGAGTAAAVAAFCTALGYAVPNGELMVPRAEIMFVPRFPARVVKVAGPAGKQASGSLATLSMGPPAVAGQLSPSDGALLLCDEPTGNLDSATTAEISGLLDGLRRDGTTLLVITHNPAVAQRAQRRVTIRDGYLAGQRGRARRGPPVKRASRAASILLAAAIAAQAGAAATGCSAVKTSGPQQTTQAPSPAPGGHA